MDRNNVKLKSEYNAYCKILKRVITLAKNNYESKYVKKISKDSKKMWQYVNTKIGKKTKATPVLDYLVCNDEIISDNQVIADEFITFFSNIGVELANKIDKISIDINKSVKHNPNSMFLTPTSYTEIEKIIKEMKDKSGGVDGISSKILKIIAKDISIPLEHIFNICIYKAIWPSVLKKADIIPIHKSRDKHLANNYRPISLISKLGKIFEKIIYIRFYDFCSKNSLISPNQFGFMKNRGTSDVLTLTSDFIYKNIVFFINYTLSFSTDVTLYKDILKHVVYHK